MPITRSFLNELRTPFDLVLSVATRVASECPDLKAALRGTSWLASPTVIMNFVPASGLTINVITPLLWQER